MPRSHAKNHPQKSAKIATSALMGKFHRKKNGVNLAAHGGGIQTHIDYFCSFLGPLAGCTPPSLTGELISHTSNSRKEKPELNDAVLVKPDHGILVGGVLAGQLSIGTWEQGKEVALAWMRASMLNHADRQISCNAKLLGNNILVEKNSIPQKIPDKSMWAFLCIFPKQRPQTNNCMVHFFSLVQDQCMDTIPSGFFIFSKEKDKCPVTY